MSDRGGISSVYVSAKLKQLHGARKSNRLFSLRTLPLAKLQRLLQTTELLKEIIQILYNGNY